MSHRECRWQKKWWQSTHFIDGVLYYFLSCPQSCFAIQRSSKVVHKWARHIVVQCICIFGYFFHASSSSSSPYSTTSFFEKSQRGVKVIKSTQNAPNFQISWKIRTTSLYMVFTVRIFEYRWQIFVQIFSLYCRENCQHDIRVNTEQWVKGCILQKKFNIKCDNLYEKPFLKVHRYLCSVW